MAKPLSEFAAESVERLGSKGGLVQRTQAALAVDFSNAFCNLSGNHRKSNGKGIQNRLSQSFESAFQLTFQLAFFPAFLPDLLGQSHRGVLQFSLRYPVQSTVEARTVNVGIKEVA